MKCRRIAVRKVAPHGALVRCFGSVASGLAGSEADLDLTLDVPSDSFFQIYCFNNAHS